MLRSRYGFHLPHGSSVTLKSRPAPSSVSRATSGWNNAELSSPARPAERAHAAGVVPSFGGGGSGWVAACGVSADASPGAGHRATLKLLEYLKVMTTRAPPVGGGGFLWAPDCFQVMQRAVFSDFPTGDRSPSLHKVIATLLSLCATRRLLGDAAQPSARARRAKTACEEGQPPNF